jgi:RNA recognition motif-containing protein
VNPRTNRPVGYAFVDLATAAEATAAIESLSGKEILARKVSVQLARKPEPAEAKEGAASGGEGASGNEGRKRTGGRGRGRGRARGRGGRAARGRVCKPQLLIPSLLRSRLSYGTSSLTGWSFLQTQDGQEPTEANATEATLLTETTNDNEPAATEGAKQGKPRAPRPQKQRGPPEDGIPSKTKVMVANLPYDLTEDKVRSCFDPTARLREALTLVSSFGIVLIASFLPYSSRKSSPTTPQSPPRSLFVPFPAL